MQPPIPSAPPKAGFLRRAFTWRNARRALIALAALITLVAIFYAVENWRGRRAWEKCKRELAAQGAGLDWAAFIPPPVPDDENIFKALKMAEWFVRTKPETSSNELSGRLSFDGLSEFVLKRSDGPLAVVTLVPFDAAIPAADADIVLRYEGSRLGLASAEAPAPPPREPDIPLIVIDHVALPDAITNLARQAKVSYVLDPKLQRDYAARPPLVSIRWEHVTARQALLALLDNYSLVLVENAANGSARIEAKDPARKGVQVDAAAAARLGELVRRAIDVHTNAPGLKSSRDFLLLAQPATSGPPARVFVRIDVVPSPETIAEFFPADALTPSRAFRSRYDVRPAGDNSFHVTMNPLRGYAAADFLAWSDAFTNDFFSIRAALKRPFAWLDGDYRMPFLIPIPNFVALRMVSQTLSDRVRCDLLLGRSDQAVRELALLRDMGRFTEGRPGMLVSAMINVAITGLYVDTLADGLRLHLWQEPDLVALEQQLASINVLPEVRDSFEAERAASCRSIEIITAEEWTKAFHRDLSFWQRVRNLEYLFFKFAPQGWRYQNMAVIAIAQRNMTDSLDLTNNRIVPFDIAARNHEIEKIATARSPCSFLAAIVVPNSGRAVQTAARNQTKVNQALVVCALERHRLARGAYPESLDALVPQFIAKLPHDLIGGQPLKYRRTDDGNFLLYSVGWNERDDGGAPGKSAGDETGSDWVWLRPAP